MASISKIEYVDEPTGLKYFEIDSRYRNRQVYPNPCDFVVPVSSTQGVLSESFLDPILLSTPYSGIQNYTGPTFIQGFTGSTGPADIPVYVILDSKETTIDNFYISSYIEIDEEPKRILEYTGLTKTAKIESQFTIMPLPNTEYIIRRKPSFFNTDIGIIDYNPFTNTVSSLNLLRPNPSPLKDFYKNSFITFTNGLHKGETTLVTRYTPTVNIPAFEQPDSTGSSEFLLSQEKGYRILPLYSGYLTNITLQAYVNDTVNAYRTVKVRIRSGEGLSGSILLDTDIQISQNTYLSLVSIDLSSFGCYLSGGVPYTLTLTDVSSPFSSGFVQLFGIESNTTSFRAYESITFPKISITAITVLNNCWNEPTANGSSSIISTTTEQGYSFPWLVDVGGANQIQILLSCYTSVAPTRDLQIRVYQGNGLSGTMVYSNVFTVPNILTPALTTFAVDTSLMVTPPNQYTISLKDVSITDGFIQIFGYQQSELPIGFTYDMFNITTYPTSIESNAFCTTTALDDNSRRDYFDPTIVYGFYFSPSFNGRLVYIDILLTSWSDINIRTLQCKILNGAGLGFPTIASVNIPVTNVDRQMVRLFFGSPNLVLGNNYTLTIQDISTGGNTTGIVYFHGIDQDGGLYIAYNTLIYPKLTIFNGIVNNIFSQPSFPSIFFPLDASDQGFFMFSEFSGNLSSIKIRITSFEGVSSGRSILLKVLDGQGLLSPVLYSNTFIIPNTPYITDYDILLTSPLPSIISLNKYTIVLSDITIGNFITGRIFLYGINPTVKYITYGFPVYPKMTVQTPSAIINISPPKSLSKFVGNNLDIIEFNIQALENSTPLYFNNLPISRSSYWAINLKYLIVPNKLISVSYGGKLDAYPYVYVHLYNDGFIGSTQTLYSNNSNTRLALFKVFVDKYIYDSPRDFFTLKPKNQSPQIVKYRPDQNIRFTITLPDGNVLRFVGDDNMSPQTPNQFVQVNALFSLWPYNMEHVF